MPNYDCGPASLFELSPDALCLLSTDINFLVVNKALLKVSGYTQSVILNRSFLGMTHIDDVDTVIANLQGLKSSGATCQFESRLLCEGEEYKWLSWNVTKLPDDQFYATAREIIQKQGFATKQTNVADSKIIDNSLDVLCTFNANRQFLSVSKAAEVIWGYTKEELIGRHFSDFVHHDDLDITSKLGTDLRSGKNVINFENRYIHKQGAVVPMTWSATWVAEEATMYCVARDTSDKKQVEQSLIASVENYKLLFHSNPLPIVIYDMGTLDIVDANVAAADLYGYTREEFLAMSIKDVRPAEEIPLIEAAIAKRDFNYDVRNLGTWNHIKKDGTPIRVEVTGNSINYMQRHCMIVVCNDVTAQANTLKSLQLSIERFEYVTAATSDIIWDWDLKSNQIAYSSNIYKAFGHTPQLETGAVRFFAKYIHPDDRERVVLFADAVRYGTMTTWTEEYRFKKANGDYAFVLDKGIVIRDENGLATRMIGAMQDITVLKQNELRILQLNDQLTEIALINAHEIRRPLASILGLIPLLDKRSIVSKSNLEVIDYLETSTIELDNVIKRIIYKTAN